MSGARLPDTAVAAEQQAALRRVAQLADEQAALRRVATLVAREAPPAQVFDAVAEELGRLLDAGSSGLVRFEDEHTATVVAGWGRLGQEVPTGARLPLGGVNVVTKVARSGRPARLDDLDQHGSGEIAERARRLKTRTAVGAPIRVSGRLWGAMVAASLEGVTMPADAGPRLEQFTELIATAISNTEARAQLQRLADEQAALRRVATLVAQAAASTEVFDAVIVEVAQLLGASQVGMMRAESPDEATIVAHRGQKPGVVHVGMRLPLVGESVTVRVLRTGRSTRMDLIDEGEGVIADLARRTDAGPTVGAPITVEGEVWGVITATWAPGVPVPADAEERLADFAELLHASIANADSRAQLTASRARVLTAGDEARRQVVRDLHDGAQQRLVQAIVTLKLAQQAFGGDTALAQTLLAEGVAHAELGNAELRELAHGILPTVLTRGGLRPAVENLVTHLGIPVDVQISVERLPQAIEASAYFIVAEALTNVVKHARATRVKVTAAVAEGTLRLEVTDDGVGGADPEGNGLLGIADRAAALGGRLRIDSSRGGGTVVAAEVPVTGA